jgi:hypothetical protein
VDFFSLPMESLSHGREVKTSLWLDSTRLDVGEDVQITESASSYKLQWSSKKLQLLSKGIEDFVWPRQWFVCLITEARFFILTKFYLKSIEFLVFSVLEF